MPRYKIALTLIPFVGDINGKKLVAYCGGVEAVFKESKKALLKIPGISAKIVDSITKPAPLFRRAEKEVQFMEENGIKALFFLDDEYPARLKHCADGPLLLYYKGTADLNARRVAAIVGTRTPTKHGKMICEKLTATLKDADVLVVSGLAYGIDICAHRSSLATGLETVGVLGSGMNVIYPDANKATAIEMMNRGAILTEFMAGTMPDRQNFPQRNRIVAGMSDVTIVIESGKRGGSLITANLAFGYNRDVAAFPGRPDDKMSAGCNALIKSNIANLIESGDDLLKLMNWDKKPKKGKAVQRSFFVEMNENEKKLFELLKDGKTHNIDSLSLKAELSMSKTSAALLSLEFKGVVKSLPGKTYRII